ncbi:MAG: indolepyruvate ferredoxin oxidoreductase subunit alpha [Bacillota bacterium]|nr:indolepyruvate ferredoxin oxidoreductase subunit alpha [Bacillota bacterium]
MKKLLSGDEAVARGAWQAGLRFAAAYPGTPSTEILENLAQMPPVRAEWAPNEKVALESAIGASLAGARAMASMKHVGLNVAADPLFTFSYTGVNGGTVIVTADEPGQYSSQNEQDNRNYAAAARLPMLEPSDSQECLDMTELAFELSEQFDVPVLLRMTTRVCHSKSIVTLGERTEAEIKPYQRNFAKYVCVPAVTQKLRVKMEQRSERLLAYSEASELNRIEYYDKSIGVICSGDCYYYAKEVFGEGASYLKLGFTWPLPAARISEFCRQVGKIYVIEENDPYIEQQVQRLGFQPIGKPFFPPYGEMTCDVLRTALYGAPLPTPAYSRGDVINRPPTLCAGCPHRGFFYEIGRRKDVLIAGDIGCYTLGSAKPYNALDSCICMGASISMGHGAAQVFDSVKAKTRVVSVIGDSTFFHTGVNSLMGAAYNQSSVVTVILDNRITGMTGHQDNPGTGYTADGKHAPAIDVEALVRALGIRQVRVVDPNHLDEVRQALDDFLPLEEPSVIITRWPCALKKFSAEDKAEFAQAFRDKNRVDEDKCIGCKLCLKCGCPALSYDAQAGSMAIDRLQCLGCNICAQLCPKDAIIKEEA